jgi:hypothetical protein
MSALEQVEVCDVKFENIEKKLDKHDVKIEQLECSMNKVDKESNVNIVFKKGIKGSRV